MSVKIRLKRIGSNKNPFYRIVVADSRRARDGRFIEEIGYYNPLTEPKIVKVDNEKAMEWIGHGARPSKTVDRLFRNNGVYEEKTVEEETIEEDTVEDKTVSEE